MKIEEMKPCPICNEEDSSLTMPEGVDRIEYVVCQDCGLRVDAESWNLIPRLKQTSEID